MQHRRTWLKSFLAIALLWAVAGAAMAYLASFEVTPQSVVAELRAQPLNALPADQRPDAVANLADRLNRLNVFERRDPTLMAEVRGQFEQMSPDEQRAFIKQIMPPGVEPMIRAVLAMPPKQRKQLIDQATSELANERTAAFREMLGDEGFDAFVVQWLTAFVNVDDPKMQFEMLPMIEQMMARLQRGRRWDDDDREEAE